jgi:hypothetical protein
MHALTLARQRIRARLQSASTPQPVRLAHGLVENGGTRALPVLSSALAQDILTRGYDAWTLDRVYCNAPDGNLGLAGKLADRTVLDLPVHIALRERHEAAVGEIAAAAVLAVRAGQPEFRALFAPCGLAAEMTAVMRRLKQSRPETFARLRCWGVDPDLHGDVLPEATRRVRAAGFEARFIREDLRRRREVDALVEREGPFHLVSALGISPQHTLEGFGEMVRHFSRIMAPNGTLVIERWENAETSPIEQGLRIEMRRHPVQAFRAVLAGAGFEIEREHPTGEGGCVVVVARKKA